MSYEQIRVNEKLGYPTCDQEGCESPVHMTFVWTRPRQYCLIHGNAALQVAQGMGFPTPQDTAQRFDLYEFEKWRSNWNYGWYQSRKDAP
jgi:hypothetical protein